MKQGKYRKRIKGMVALAFAALLLMNAVAFAENTVWNCSDCGKTGNTKNSCGRCGHAAPWMEEPEAESPKNLSRLAA